ncbi:MAG: hypothetical protein ISQ13_04700 [Candidatus Margulisbacteria bacterium]|nr:hypothetical protein [Candidatus Margulisiibacteriota bacterium]
MLSSTNTGFRPSPPGTPNSSTKRRRSTSPGPTGLNSKEPCGGVGGSNSNGERVITPEPDFIKPPDYTTPPASPIKCAGTPTTLITDQHLANEGDVKIVTDSTDDSGNPIKIKHFKFKGPINSSDLKGLVDHFKKMANEIRVEEQLKKLLSLFGETGLEIEVRDTQYKLHAVSTTVTKDLAFQQQEFLDDHQTNNEIKKEVCHVMFKALVLKSIDDGYFFIPDLKPANVSFIRQQDGSINVYFFDICYNTGDHEFDEVYSLIRSHLKTHCGQGEHDVDTFINEELRSNPKFNEMKWNDVDTGAFLKSNEQGVQVFLETLPKPKVRFGRTSNPVTFQTILDYLNGNASSNGDQKNPEEFLDSSQKTGCATTLFDKLVDSLQGKSSAQGDSCIGAAGFLTPTD